MPTQLSIVIPVYNEEETLSEMFARLPATFDSIPDLQWKAIFVNDGSRDRTVAMIEEAHARDARFTLIDLSRNFGHQAAMSAGLAHADGDVVAMMDGDLQDPPEVIPKLLEKWREGYQVVYAVRRKRKEGLIKRTAYAMFYRSMKAIAAIDIPLDAGDFCLVDKAVAQAMAALPERNRFLRGLRSWLGFKQIGVEYERAQRFAGATKYSLRKLIRLALAGYVGFSSMPLRISAWIGLLAAFGGFCVLAWALIARLSGSPIPAGWTSTMAVILFLGGTQLLMLGVIGEYLGN
ncbi:MAG TPA: glycosyltransferase family 2 protein, partial [Phycisphaerales bacterium]|nr:glycosyltransferase family 2 protein [Phycisphaerales bacterium]